MTDDRPGHATPDNPAEAATVPAGVLDHVPALARIALPLALSELSEMAMGVTDTVLLGGLGVTAVAIGGLSGTFFFTTMVTFQAILGGAGVLLSHGRGARDHGHASHDGRSVISATVMLAIAVFVPCAILLSSSGVIFAALGEPVEVVSNGGRFIDILLLSLLPDLAMIGVLRVVLPALGAETLLLWIMPAMAVCNGFANAALIYGWAGLPALGLFGSATASTLTSWVMSLALLGLCLSRPDLRGVFRPAPVRWEIVKELLRLGAPMMMGAAAEILMFQITSLRAGELGTRSLAVHQIALNVTTLLFMVFMALGQATNVRVAYWRGAGQMVQSRRAALAGTCVTLCWGTLTSALFLLFPQLIMSLYFHDHAPDPETAKLIVSILRIAGLYQIVDGLQTVFGGALRGCGDTVTPMIMAVCSYGVVGLGFGGWLAFQRHFGLIGLWIGMGLALGLTSAGFGIRLVRVLKQPAPLVTG